MLELLQQSELVNSITGLVLNSLIPGLGLLVLLLIGRQVLAKRVNAATQYAVTFSALVVLIAAVVFVPALSFFELSSNRLNETDASHAYLDVTSPAQEPIDEMTENRILNKNYILDPSAPTPPARADQSEVTFEADDEFGDQALVLNSGGEASPPTPQAQLRAFHIEVPSDWVPVIFSLWLFGVFVMSLRLLISYGYLTHIKQRAFIPTHGQLRDLRALQRNAGVGRRVRFLISDDIAVPVLAGLVRPAILMPRYLIEHLTKQELEQVVLHELAHLKRYDDWGKFFQYIMQIPLFFHPAIWVISRALDFTREVACDDWLIAQRKIGRQPYSLSLCKVAEWSLAKRSPIASATLGMATSKTQIERRIKLLLDKRREIFSGVRVGRWAFFSAGLIAVVLLLISAAPQVKIAVANDAEAVPDVIYKHTIYKPLSTHTSLWSALDLQLPPESEDWWSDIESISFPELSGIELFNFTLNTRESSVFVSLSNITNLLQDRLTLTLRFRANTTGVQDATYLRAVDKNGITWRVSLGRIRFDVRDGTIFSQRNPVLERCVAPISIVSSTYVNQLSLIDVRDVPSIDVVEIAWGEELLSSLGSPHFGLSLIGEPGRTSQPVELPARVESELHVLNASLLLTSEQPLDSFVMSEFFVGYRKGNENGEVVYEVAPSCTRLSGPDENVASFQPIKLEEVRTAQTTTATPVIYKHLSYQPMNTGVGRDLNLTIQSQAREFWKNIREISFPEAPHIRPVTEISSYGMPHNLISIPTRSVDHDGNEYFPNKLNMSINNVVASESGTFEITKIEVVDNSNARYEVPVGRILFDVRDASLLEERAGIFNRCRDGRTYEVESELSFITMRGTHTYTRQAPAEIVDILWGEELFSQFENVDFQITDSVIYDELNVLVVPFVLAQFMDLVTTLSIASPNTDAILSAEPFIGYRLSDTEYAGELIYEPLSCVAFISPDLEYTQYEAIKLN